MTARLSVLEAGDQLLVCDNVYRPPRNFCDGSLSRFGIATSNFDPLAGAPIEEPFRSNTKAVLLRGPHPRHQPLTTKRRLGALKWQFDCVRPDTRDR